jgi:hypothetical protein
MRNNKIFLVVDLVPQEEVIVIAYTKKKKRSYAQQWNGPHTSLTWWGGQLTLTISLVHPNEKTVCLHSSQSG